MLKAPHHQVAGHQALNGNLGPLIDDSGRFYKPLQDGERGLNEVAFYTTFYSDSRIPDNIHVFFPKFYGTKLIESSDGSGLRPHLVLEDLNSVRVNPSVVDIKIGSRTWPPEASEDYFLKCLKKDRATSSVSLGFRLSGLQIFQNKHSDFWKPDKKSIQKLLADEVKVILKKFVSYDVSYDMDSVPDGGLASVVYGGSTGILSQLMKLKAWFEDQTIYHFYSCSILMAYEKERAIEGNNSHAEIKLIDFAHVVEGKGVIDHNFLGGLCSLIKFISEILTDLEKSTMRSSSKGT